MKNHSRYNVRLSYTANGVSHSEMLFSTTVREEAHTVADDCESILNDALSAAIGFERSEAYSCFFDIIERGDNHFSAMPYRDYVEWRLFKAFEEKPDDFSIYVEVETEKFPFIIEEYDAVDEISGEYGYYDFAEAADDFSKWEKDSAFRGVLTLHHWNVNKNCYETVSEIVR